MPFKFERLKIPDVVLISPTVFKDERGDFAETYKRSEFAAFGIDATFHQDSCSVSRKGVVRGLHYQLNPKAQGKLLRVVAGAAFEVAVDLRKGSPHFGQWVGASLSAANRAILWIPEGFAAGLASLSDDCTLLYKVTNEYSKSHERSILWNDPEIGVQWPVGGKPVLSDKDAAAPLLKNAEINYSFGPSR